MGVFYKEVSPCQMKNRDPCLVDCLKSKLLHIWKTHLLVITRMFPSLLTKWAVSQMNCLPNGSQVKLEIMFQDESFAPATASFPASLLPSSPFTSSHLR